MATTDPNRNSPTGESNAPFSRPNNQCDQVAHQVHGCLLGTGVESDPWHLVRQPPPPAKYEWDERVKACLDERYRQKMIMTMTTFVAPAAFDTFIKLISLNSDKSGAPNRLLKFSSHWAGTDVVQGCVQDRPIVGRHRNLYVWIRGVVV